MSPPACERVDPVPTAVLGSVVDPELFSAPSTVPLDLYAGAGGVFIAPDLTDQTNLDMAGFMLGSLVLDQASTAPRGVISGTLDAQIYGLKFWKD